ncbi:hypothetical protein B296_00055542 [Ensete ventricosum]|uniref:Uncharacterized protein n=1 Tax=Ensete ventricosum TaxID=4639 RepID=A0A426XZH6_ENSVE|nr:hypothetical protein B296_00055542 [Ensete ventricosum]
MGMLPMVHRDDPPQEVGTGTAGGRRTACVHPGRVYTATHAVASGLLGGGGFLAEPSGSTRSRRRLPPATPGTGRRRLRGGGMVHRCG